MNKCRKLGFVTYNGTLEVHSSLLNVALHDKSSLQEALRLGRVSCDVVTIDQSGFSPRA